MTRWAERLRAALRRRAYRPGSARVPAPGSAPAVPPGRFAFLTSCYDTPPEFVRELAASIAAQTAQGARWVLVDNGSTKAATRDCLSELARAEHVQLVRVEHNRGILGGMRTALEACTAAFAIPVDADDLVAPTTIESFAAAIARSDGARFLFADEDHLTDGRRRDPFLRPGWDPALALATSYIWHPCCFSRDEALRLGLYSDPGANYCHDWDTLLRFVRAGHRPVHVPAVLYSWRTHAASTTNNQRDAHAGSLASQRHVLRRHVECLDLADRFAVEDCPLWRGAPELRLRRLPTAVPNVDLLVTAVGPDAQAQLRSIAAALRAVAPLRRCHVWSPTALADVPAGWHAHHGDLAAAFAALAAAEAPPFALAIRRADVDIREPDWLLEGIGWLELVADIDVVGPRALDARGRVLTAGDFADADGAWRTPDRGRDAADPGALAMALKPRCCDAVHSGAIVVRGEALAAAAADLAASTLPLPAAVLGAGLAASARRRGRRVVATPFVTVVDGGAAAHLPAGALAAEWRRSRAGA